MCDFTVVEISFFANTSRLDSANNRPHYTCFYLI